MRATHLTFLTSREFTKQTEKHMSAERLLTVPPATSLFLNPKLLYAILYLKSTH